MPSFPAFLILHWWTRTASVSLWATSTSDIYSQLFFICFSLSASEVKDVGRTQHAWATWVQSNSLYRNGFNNNSKTEHVHQKLLLAYLQLLTKHGHKTTVPQVTEINFQKQILQQILQFLLTPYSPPTLLHALNNLPKLSVFSSFRMWRQAELA